MDTEDAYREKDGDSEDDGARKDDGAYDVPPSESDDSISDAAEEEEGRRPCKRRKTSDKAVKKNPGKTAMIKSEGGKGAQVTFVVWCHKPGVTDERLRRKTQALQRVDISMDIAQTKNVLSFLSDINDKLKDSCSAAAAVHQHLAHPPASYVYIPADTAATSIYVNGTAPSEVVQTVIATHEEDDGGEGGVELHALWVKEWKKQIGTRDQAYGASSSSSSSGGGGGSVGAKASKAHKGAVTEIEVLVRFGFRKVEAASMTGTAFMGVSTRRVITLSDFEKLQPPPSFRHTPYSTAGLTQVTLQSLEHEHVTMCPVETPHSIH